MKRPGDHPLHTLLLLTERPGRWAAWQIAPLSPLLAAAAGWSWAHATHRPVLGWAVALGLVALALADWALLASLPRQGLSFGPVQPPWLGLVLFRGLMALLAAAVAGHGPLPALIGLALFQAGASGLLAYGALVEPFRLQVSRVEISDARFANPGTPLRLVQLADLHVERLTRREHALPALIAGLSPDLILLTGDYLNTSYNADPHALADLHRLLAQIGAPGGVYAVWGTAEVDLPELLRPLFAELGITLLEDRAAEVVMGDHHLWLVGLSCTRDLAAAGQRLRTLLAGVPSEAFTLLLYHTPDLMPQAASLGVDLYLAGHTHGGQWRLPGFGAILTSSRYWKRYEAGHNQQNRTHLYVSRGLGMEGFGAPRLRLFCPPEVVLIEVRGTEGP